MGELFSQVIEILGEVFRHLLDTPALMSTLGKPELMVAAFIALNIIVFTETGLLIGFFLPGDSLLVTAGLVAATANPPWNVTLLISTLCISAVIGDSVGYAIGRRTGPRIFTREKSFFFRRDHLLAAQAFYERHGGKTIVLARFMPIVRTFAPVVAGVGQMNYRRFLAFNVFGGIAWVVSMVLLGYYLPELIDPICKRLFGEQFQVVRHVEKVIIVVVLLSISPGVIAWVRTKFARRKAPVSETITAA